MKALIKSEALSIGLAMFSMFFGAGNIIFPLALGQYAGDKNFLAVMGLILTAVIMPFAGVIAMIIFDGDYKRFFAKLGRAPGFILSVMIMGLLGPLGSTPRCIALSFSTLKTYFPSISPIIFSLLACSIIFCFTIRKNRLLQFLGWVLTPALLCSLIAIIVMGFSSSPDTQILGHGNSQVFFHGLKEGYNTMDLLAAFFFSSSILAILKTKNSQHKTTSSYIKTAIHASIIGAILLAAIYIGFSFIAAFHGADLTASSKDQLLTALTTKIAGSYAGLLVCITVALACLTTAIALISIFADFIHKQVVREKISYNWIVIGSITLTFFVSILEFTKISSFLAPILQICYPGLIVLTFANIISEVTEYTIPKWIIMLTFAASTMLYFL